MAGRGNTVIMPRLRTVTRKLRVQTLSGAQCPTERDVRNALAPMIAQLNSETSAGQLTATMGTALDKYLNQELPKLKISTQCTNKSLIELHIRSRWGMSVHLILRLQGAPMRSDA